MPPAKQRRRRRQQALERLRCDRELTDAEEAA
jgi:hypothetical protein